jgi:hypothetical protein
MRFFIFFIAMMLSVFSSSVFAAMYGSTLCKEEGFHCLKIHGGQSWRSLWPDPHDRDIVMRVNRMNTGLYPGLRIAVPDNVEEADIMDFSPFPAQTDSSGEKLIIVDPITRAWGAYDEAGSLVRWGPVSAGADWCRDIDEACHTHPGSYRIFTLGSSSCYSTKFPLPDGGAPMPYCMYFHNGQALHGEPNGLPGYNASHGCVRLYVNDAEWLRYDFVSGPSAENSYRGTRVVIKPYETPEPSDDNNDENRRVDENDESY